MGTQGDKASGSVLLCSHQTGGGSALEDVTPNHGLASTSLLYTILPDSVVVPTYSLPAHFSTKDVGGEL